MDQFLKRLGVFLEAIKFSHSVFALPFALISMMVAAGGWPSLWTLFWIVVACVAARTAAMCFNRLVDRRFDAANPRTAKRALVTGELSVEFVVAATGISAVVFFVAAGMLNFTCLVLAPPTLAVLLFYSLTKRFTRLSHFFLGLALGLAPIGAWIAVTGSIALTPLLLAAGVLLWVAGFDILYSCQDFEVDRKSPELHSIPKAMGVAGAMALARKAHGACLALFFAVWWVAGLGPLFLLGVAAMGALLQYQHRLVSPTDLSRIDAAFFLTNGLIAIGLFGVTVLDYALGI